jgi:protein-arginine kinase activator protein McsA
MLSRKIENLFNEFLWNYHIKGSTETERGSDKNGDWVKKTFKSDDGSFYSSTTIRTNSTRIDEIQELKLELDELIQNERFEDAIVVLDKLKKMEQHKEKIAKLKHELNLSIQNQNFEASIKIRDEIKKLTS